MKLYRASIISRKTGKVIYKSNRHCKDSAAIMLQRNLAGRRIGWYNIKIEELKRKVA